jgi:hypothetical protein
LCRPAPIGGLFVINSLVVEHRTKLRPPRPWKKRIGRRVDWL